MSFDLINIANQDESWALLPSDPAIFNDMIKEYGVKDVKVQEVYSLDFDYLKAESPVYGFIFASECREEELSNDFDEYDPAAEFIIYTTQIITNICGTLALLAVLFNVDIYRGELLESFLNFTKDFSPINRGMALGNSPTIRNIHHAYARSKHESDCYTMDLDTDDLADSNQELTEVENYHYVSYIYKIGYIWELDGLKGRPIKLTACEEENWIDALKPILERRMNASNDEEIAFSLMAITHDPLSSKKEELRIYNDCLQQINQVKGLEKEKIQISMNKFFNTYPNNDITGSRIMHELWLATTWHQDYVIMKKTTELNSIKESLNREINLAEQDSQEATADILRQKFDYFVFLEQLFRVAHEKNVLEQCEEYTKVTHIPKRRGRKPNLDKQKGPDGRKHTPKENKSSAKQGVTEKITKGRRGRKPRSATVLA
ncbi:hypothetical protein G6F46_002218 [Rhizopus delemar]|uniref:Ubiquitin carboxyl-terminal hydrolase n=2 Tax=Rhizopus TaxID=4842 RepID=A0A9P6ZBB6_9FUNG|nr:hypothetical protein G6F55_001596 [Rhizopus delemar]KAG1553129.1 hypothetical protein G6F51_000774 [Rhizopus arrhizus]KAG1503038.1 hypothetical protein G6F54_001938 [Rhizopus delemar]KAG1516741.1 hypothetical protein G6F53_001930 [Rhizopus delemar]KAG1528624.1 hypothetical protein G6F52_000475 [Rhizopus delemar]